MISCDPLQTLSLALRFCRIITGHPILSVSFARGRLEQLIELRYSTGYIRIPSCPLPWLFAMESALWKTLGWPGNFSRIVLLISSTSSFQLQRMVNSEQYWSLWCCHIPFSSFLCSFIFDYFLDSVMPQHLFCVPYSITNNHHPSILCPLSIFCPLSPCHSIIHLCHHLFHLLSPDSLPLCSVSIFIFLTSIHYSLPPCSNFDYSSFCPL